MEKEREILSQKDAVIKLVPKPSGKGRVVKGLGFVVGGAIGSGLVGAHQMKGELKSLSHIKNVSEGNIGDIVHAKKGQLILTNNHIILHYQTGFRKKTDKMLALKLQHAKSVEERGFMSNKHLHVGFEIPSEEKPINFDLKIWVKNRAPWFTELTRLIQ